MNFGYPRCLAVSLVLSAKAYHEDKMDVGDFVAVNVWIVQLFTPLNFLGTVYNTIITSFVDLRNLSQLMGQQPDIVDRPGSIRMFMRLLISIDYAHYYIAKENEIARCCLRYLNTSNNAIMPEF